ncbi:MAG: antitoxin component YwqK of YwqJK toxin-antitoxin module, partial [Cyclobacteriaceae bacterium]
MVRTLTFLCFIGSLSYASAQSSDRQTVYTYYRDSGGKIKEELSLVMRDTIELDGPYIMRDRNGSIAIEGFYVENMRHGLFTNYYADGTTQRETTYENGLRQGATRVYDKDGSVLQEAFFENDTLSGAISLFDQEGQLVSETAFKEGLPDGPVLTYFPNGSIESEVTYKGG